MTKDEIIEHYCSRAMYMTAQYVPNHNVKIGVGEKHIVRAIDVDKDILYCYSEDGDEMMHVGVDCQWDWVRVFVQVY